MQENDIAAATDAPADDATGETAETSETTTAETSETTTDSTLENTLENTSENADDNEEITYHAVQKDNSVTAIWEMQGRKHIRTIDPRSREGQEILRLFTAEEGEENFEQAA